MLAHRGQADAGRTIAVEALDGAAELGPFMEGTVYAALAFAALASGDVDAAFAASEATRQRLDGMLPRRATTASKPAAQVALARGESDVSASFRR